MKRILILVGVLTAGSIMSVAQWNPNPNGTTHIYNTNTGNVGIGIGSTTIPQINLEVVGFGQIIRNTNAGSYTTFRLYNDANNSFRALEVAYSGSGYIGSLSTTGPLGESGSISTSGPYPLSIGTNNTSRMVITSSGNIGIGVPAPVQKLEVAGSILTTSNYGLMIAPPSGDAIIKRGNPGSLMLCSNGGASDIRLNYAYGGGSGGVQIFDGGTTNSASFVVNSSGNLSITTSGGNVGIGTASPDAKLAVKGVIHTQEVRVDMQGSMVPDYVFEETYNLPSLIDTENYIKQNKHLPEVPSACEMEEKGINLSEMNMLLLKKVEELTLYVIELKKRDELQEKEIEELKNKK